MPIIIEQIEKLDSDPGGLRRYLLRVNYTTIGTFSHKRSDGLEVCLQKAAETAKQSELEEISRFADTIMHKAIELRRP